MGLKAIILSISFFAASVAHADALQNTAAALFVKGWACGVAAETICTKWNAIMPQKITQFESKDACVTFKNDFKTKQLGEGISVNRKKQAQAHKGDATALTQLVDSYPNVTCDNTCIKLMSTLEADKKKTCANFKERFKKAVLASK